MAYGRYPVGTPGAIPHYGSLSDDGQAERQAFAEFNEALGQLETAAGIWGAGGGIGRLAVPAPGSRKWITPTQRELAAHKIREAVNNLQDVVRFMELP